MTLTGVSETLCIPLAARVLETRREDGVFADPRGAEMADTLGLDVDRYGRSWTQVEAVVGRTVLLDAVVRDFLARHPDGQVVALGAGLCTRAWRLGAGRWVHVDLPAVAELRGRLLPDEPGRITVAASVLDADWWDHVEHGPTLFTAEGLLMYLAPEDVEALLRELARRRPGAEVVLEGIATFLLRSRFGQRSRTIADTGATFRWGLDAAEDLLAIVPGARLLSVGHHAEVLPGRWRWLRVTRPFTAVRQAMRIVHLELPA